MEVARGGQEPGPDAQRIAGNGKGGGLPIEDDDGEVTEKARGEVDALFLIPLCQHSSLTAPSHRGMVEHPINHHEQISIIVGVDPAAVS